MIQRSDDGGKTWEPVGNEFAYDGVPGHAPVVRRHAASLGIQASLASRTVADRSGYRLRRGGRRRLVPLGGRRPDLAGALRAARPRVGAALAAGRRRDVPAHDPAGSERSRADLHRDLGRGRLPNRRRRQDVAADQPRPAVRSTSPTRRPRSATASTGSRCTRRVRTCCSCRSTGTSCAATTPASRGTRSAATCRPTSGSRSTSMRTSRRPSTSSRSRATPSITRSTASCASTAAGRAETSGKPLTEGPAAERLLRQRVARRDGRRLARFVRRVFRHHRRPGVRVGRCRR